MRATIGENATAGIHASYHNFLPFSLFLAAFGVTFRKKTKMDEVFAWVADQRDRNRSGFYRFLEQQRNRWMPNHVFNRCCVKWLVDGNYTWDEFQDEYSFCNGCQGNCGREHPRIVLDFDVARKVTTATLSHPELAPFQRYFQECVNQETAWVRDRSSYELNGFIRENQTKLRTQQYFGSLELWKLRMLQNENNWKKHAPPNDPRLAVQLTWMCWKRQ